jgi:hypothetical protein
MVKAIVKFLTDKDRWLSKTGRIRHALKTYKVFIGKITSGFNGVFKIIWILRKVLIRQM